MSLSFVCPTTGDVVSTGIRTDRQTRTVTRNIRLYVRCDRCGEEHCFAVKEALAEAA